MSPTPPPGERSKADPESPTNPTPAQVHDLVPLRTSTREWFKISLQTFGGPAGQIAVMQRSLVDEHRWIGERRFLHALSYCMTAICPAGPPKVCREILNHARVDVRKGTRSWTCAGVGFVGDSGSALDRSPGGGVGLIGLSFR